MTDAPAQQPRNEITVFQSTLKSMAPQFKAALPSHIHPDKFIRVVQTAVQLDPDLMLADRRTLLAACTRCAQDGLLPDKREAALVTFNVNVGTKEKPKYEKQVQYMPMFAGIMKKARNSGTIANWSVHVIKEKDAFDYELGDSEQLKHKPTLGERGKTIGAYSIVTLKSGEKSREIMSVDEIEAVRKRSRTSGSGPWVTDFDEMARKTVIRRHSKRLDMDTEEADHQLRETIEADDALTDLTVVDDRHLPPVIEHERPSAPTRLPRGKAAQPVQQTPAGQVLEDGHEPPPPDVVADPEMP